MVHRMTGRLLGVMLRLGLSQAALMNANGGSADGARREGWLGSRLLGTASKIVTSGASFLYSSVFRRPAGDGLLLLKEAEKTAGEIRDAPALAYQGSI